MQIKLVFILSFVFFDLEPKANAWALSVPTILTV
jgi:hypothetical protein